MRHFFRIMGARLSTYPAAALRRPAPRPRQKLLCLGLVVLGTCGNCVAGAAPGASAAAPPIIGMPASLTVTLDDNYPPYVFRDTNGILTGYLVDSWKLWQSKTGIPVNLVATDWDKAKQVMQAGQAQVIDTIFETPERDRTLDFTPPYASIPVMLYTDARIGGITNLDTLHGFLVGVKAGDACADQLTAGGIDTVQSYPNYQALIQAAAAQKIRVFCLDQPPASYLLYRNHLDQQFNQAFQINTGAFRRAVHKGDWATLALVERGFNAITPAEEKFLRDKWMGHGLESARYTLYLTYAGLAAALGLGLLSLWGLLLKRLVRQRTVELETERVYLRSLIESIPDLVWVKDPQGIYLSCNPPFERFFDALAHEIVGKTDYDFVSREVADAFRVHDLKAMEANQPRTNLEWVTMASDQQRHLFETIKTPMRDAAHNLLGVLGTARDVTVHHQAEATQKKLNRALKLLSQCNHTLVHAEDEHKLLSEICQLAVDIGGYRMAWVGFKEYDAAKTVRPVAWSGKHSRYLEQVTVSWADGDIGHGVIGSAAREGITVVNQDYLDPAMAAWSEIALKHGFRSSIGLALKGRKGVLGVLAIHAGEAHAFGTEEIALLEELTNDLAYGIETLRTRIEQEAAEQELAFLAHHDPLTGLPNRLLLHDRFQQAAAAAQREDSGVALLFLDLDNFKNVNDSLGHSYGDQLLVKVVERLKSCVRETDTISRQGGDEFVILLTQLSDLSVVGAIAHHIIEAFAEPFPIDSYMLTASFSIGISLYPQDGQPFETLLKLADTALHQAKDSGRNNYRFFVENMNANAQEQVKLQGQLHSAVRNREFVLHYQPQVEIGTGRIVGAEALIRWQHPERGLVPPGTFIPLAERSGLIIPMGAWVLNEACRQAQAWRDDGLPMATMAVNLSALQFRRGNLLETVVHALSTSGLPASHLELELTESILLQDIEAAIRTLYSLREMGVKLSIDDFGTGYSSLSYLKRLAVNKLKIDQSFVRDLAEDPDDAAIVKAIIQLGHNLQLTVIAEGVETMAQWDFLQNCGCDEAQGYLLSKPVPAAEFAALCQQPTLFAGQAGTD